MRRFLCIAFFLSFFNYGFSQDSTAQFQDSSLRIIDLNPSFTLHVDSTLSYQLHINKDASKYFWYLKHAPVGLRINKETGMLSFRADKSYFISGRLKYDYNYNVTVGVQSLYNPSDKVDTTFSITFFNTEIITPTLKPTVGGTIWVNEGETLAFKVMCEAGNFPIDGIITLTSEPIGPFVPVQKCGDEFNWTPSYDFVKETDSAKVKPVTITFIGSTKYKIQDTARIRLIVKNALNYPQAKAQYEQTVHEINVYLLQLKYTFLQLDKTVKKTRNVRTGFDLTAAGTALSGTVLSTSSNDASKRTGQILPGVGVALTPVKEATAPTKTAEQNQATLIRSSIKRLSYVLQDNALIGDKDPDVVQKTNRLREELKQIQMQLIDVPIEFDNTMTEAELDKYFNSPKVNKKYRLKNK